VGPVYISKDVMERTVRITFVGKLPFRTDVVALLKDFGYVHSKHGLEALYQRDRAMEFYAVFNGVASAYHFSELGQQEIKNYTRRCLLLTFHQRE
jgi:hypothetical protein